MHIFQVKTILIASYVLYSQTGTPFSHEVHRPLQKHPKKAKLTIFLGAHHKGQKTLDKIIQISDYRD